MLLKEMNFGDTRQRQYLSIYRGYKDKQKILKLRVPRQQ